MFKNTVIELFPEESKKVLYKALKDGKKVYYTTHRRGIPAETYVYDTKDVYCEIIINPEPKLMCYVDKELLSMGEAFNKQFTAEDKKMFIDYLGKHSEKDCERALNDLARQLGCQYSPEDIKRYILRLRPEFDGCGEADCSDFSHIVNEIWLCPKCGEPVEDNKDCKECGQLIDWDYERNTF